MQAKLRALERLKALREGFVASLPGRIGDLQSAIDSLGKANDEDARRQALGALTTHAHKLAGTGGTYGFQALSKAARSMEHYCEAQTRATDTPLATVLGTLNAYLDTIQRSAEEPPEISDGLNFQMPESLDNDSDATTATPSDPTGKHIILLEDDPEHARQSISILENIGYQISWLQEPGQLAAALAKQPADAMLVDIMFPDDRDAGARALLELRDKGEVACPVIFTSGRDDFDARLAAVKAGSSAYLRKPINSIELIETLSFVTSQRQREKYRVMMIDDDRDMLDYYTLHLEAADFIVSAVDDPIQAIDRINDFNPDVLLLDIDMPACNGIELAAVIRQNVEYMRLPIVFLTARQARDDKLSALLAGGDDFISKPAKLDYLIPSLNTRAEKNRLRLSLDKQSKSRESMNQFLSMARVMPIGFFYTDNDGNCIYLNEKCTAIIGEQAGAMLGKPWLSYIADFDRERIAHKWQALQQTGETLEEEISFYTEERNRVWVIVKVSASNDSKGRLNGYIGSFTEITKLKQAENDVQQLAHFDSLTGLPNRLLMSARLDQAIKHAKRNNSIFYMLFVDLDGFKAINDTMGHAAGDKLLQGIAQRMRRVLREEDTVARIGGDEFALIIERIDDGSQVENIAQKLLASVAKPVQIDGSTIHLSASIGISAYPHDGTDGDLLLRQADMAMYRAKSRGANTFEYYHPELTDAALKNRKLEEAIRSGIRNNEWVLHYQPKVNICSGEISGVEALLRWKNAQYTHLPIQQCVEAAEKISQMEALGYWILRQACEQLRAWQHKQLPIKKVAVNVSIMQIQRPDFVQNLQAIIEETGISGESLELEITESVIIENSQQADKSLREMKALGVQISIDDFGTGYSSLSRLKMLPVDRVKIDQSFVQDIVGNKDGEEMVHTIIVMGKNLGLKVTAEGIETREQYNLLRAKGCDEAQGFLLSEPVAAQTLEIWCASYQPGIAIQQRTAAQK